MWESLSEKFRALFSHSFLEQSRETTMLWWSRYADGSQVCYPHSWTTPVDQVAWGRTLRQLVSSAHSLLQSACLGQTTCQGAWCQRSLSLFHNLTKYNPWSSLMTLFLCRKTFIKAKTGVTHHYSLYHLRQYPKLPKRAYLETETFPCWMQAQRAIFFFFSPVKCGSVYLAIFSYAFFPLPYIRK